MLTALRSDLFTVTKETNKYYNGLGVSIDKFEALGFNVSDFEFYLTDRPEEKGKYQISAFWNKNIIQAGKNHLDGWCNFIDEIRDSNNNSRKDIGFFCRPHLFVDIHV